MFKAQKPSTRSLWRSWHSRRLHL